MAEAEQKQILSLKLENFMVRLDYRKETFSKVSVCGILCEFNDMSIDRSTVPKGKYLYEVLVMMKAAVSRQGSNGESW